MNDEHKRRRRKSVGEVKCAPPRKRVAIDEDKCTKLKPGCWLVFHNGTLSMVEVYEPHVFDDYAGAESYINDQLKSYPGLDYYTCQVMECHHTTIQKHVRRLV